MNMGQDELQEKLEALEAGEPLDLCAAGLEEEESALLHLAANLQTNPGPGSRCSSSGCATRIVNGEGTNHGWRNHAKQKNLV